jgi:hypothetical protein
MIEDELFRGIYEDATGVHGELSYKERLERTTAKLIDHLKEDNSWPLRDEMGLTLYLAHHIAYALIQQCNYLITAHADEVVFDDDPTHKVEAAAR